LISGFFTPGSHDRKGGRAFVRDRLVRLGIPLVVFLVLLRPLLMAPAPRGLEYWQWYLVSWDPGPLWFVEVLLVFALAYALWRRRRGAPTPAPGPRPLTFRAIALFTLGLAVVTFLWRFPVPQTSYVPILGLPTPYFLPQYTAMFVAGTVAFRRGWFASLPRRAGWIGFTVAGVATAAYLPVAAATNPVVVQAATALWESVFASGVICGLVVLFRKRFDTQGRFGRFLSAHAYTVYIVHPLVLVAVAKAMRPLETIAVAKFALLLAVAAPLCWALAYAVRSIPGAKRVL
ncbi:MAG: acyltransferase family protein, partial [Micromonosporaceae bacterium]